MDIKLWCLFLQLQFANVRSLHGKRGQYRNYTTAQRGKPPTYLLACSVEMHQIVAEVKNQSILSPPTHHCGPFSSMFCQNF